MTVHVITVFQSLAEFILMFWKDKPVDWLLEDILYTKVCNPEKDPISCQNEKKKIKKNITPSQFQHIGTYSSLSGKIQKLQDSSFNGKQGGGKPKPAGQPMLKRKPGTFLIPPLESFFTNIPSHEAYTLENFISNKTDFWGSKATNGSVIILVLKEKIKLSRFSISSGPKEHPDDILPQGTLVYYSSDSIQKNDWLEKNKKSKSIEFNEMGKVENGIFEINYSNNTGPIIKTIKIEIHENSKFWIYISELYIGRAP